jgi:rhodanese-related sulfurtransferase
MAKEISQQQLQLLLNSDEEFALIDVRERNEYENGQIFGATQVPRRLLESRIPVAIPVKNTKVVLYDNDNVRSELAAGTLEKHGYTNLYVLTGGLDAWKKAGLPVVRGVHVLSKAFGEIVGEVRQDVSRLSPAEVKALVDSGDDNFVIIEVRPQEEVSKTGSIPGAIAIPGVELPLRVADYAQRGRKIITTCAGRTRGYISCATLKLMGIPHIYDLDNGTKGWRLAGFELQKKIPQGPAPSAQSREKADRFAEKLIKEEGLQTISAGQLRDLRQKAGQETLYLLDVRTREEYEFIGHIPGAVSIPGGQAIQNTDDTAPVRNGKIVFICDNGTRAAITAYWYKQMGFSHIYVLEGGLQSWTQAGNALVSGSGETVPLGFAEAAQQVAKISASALKGAIDQKQDITIVDIGDSKAFAAGHLPGARRVPRGWLEKRIGDVVPDKKRFLVVTGQERFGPVLAAKTLTDLGFHHVRVLAGGTDSWQAAGYRLDDGLEGVEPDDWFVHLTEYNLERSDQYIKWEKELAYLPEYMAYFRRRGILPPG